MEQLTKSIDSLRDINMMIEVSKESSLFLSSIDKMDC